MSHAIAILAMAGCSCFAGFSSWRAWSDGDEGSAVGFAILAFVFVIVTIGTAAS